MKLYKLTDENDQTYGGCQWGENVTIETSGEGGLCGPGWTHWYTDPLLAVLLNPIHADFDIKTAHLWEGEGRVEKSNKGLKVGCSKATTLKRITIPQVTREQHVAFGILCALQVYHDEVFEQWAKDWLSGNDRSVRAAAAAVEAVEAAGAARGAEATRAASWAAEAAVTAVEAAVEAVLTATRAAAEAALTAAWAAEAVEAAVEAAGAARGAEATRAAAEKNPSIDLIIIANQALNY